MIHPGTQTNTNGTQPTPTPASTHPAQTRNMPQLSHADSRERCRQGWELRRKGRTWDEVATALGWKSRAAACKAVNTWLAKNPPDDMETMRRASGDTLVEMTTKLAAAVDDAIDAGKYRDAAELGKVVIDGVDKYAKLTGQHVVQPKQIDVTVTQTLSEVLAGARERLLAVIDAEVIELPEPAPRAVGA